MRALRCILSTTRALALRDLNIVSAGRSSRHIVWRSCYAALAPPAEDNFDILSMALASEYPQRRC